MKMKYLAQLLLENTNHWYKNKRQKGMENQMNVDYCFFSCYNDASPQIILYTTRGDRVYKNKTYLVFYMM